MKKKNNKAKQFREDDLNARHAFEDLVTEHYDVLYKLAEAHNFSFSARIETPFGYFVFIPNNSQFAYRLSD